MRHEEKAYSMGYRVTEDGRVIGLRVGERKLRLSSAGYYQFSYSHDTPRIKVHRLQAYQKFGEKIYEKGIVVRHLDGNCLNNSIYNIDVGTYSQNMFDKPKELRLRQGRYAASFLRKLTPDQVTQIRTEYASGIEGIELARRHGVAKTTISGIVTGKMYSDVSGPISLPKNRGNRKMAT